MTDPAPSFRDLVTNDAFSENAEMRATLAAEEGGYDRWRNMLVEILEGTNATLTSLDADIADYRTVQRSVAHYRSTMAEFRDKRARTVHFKTKIESRLREVNGLIKGAHRSQESHLVQVKNLCLWLLDEFEDLDDLARDVPDDLVDTFESMRRWLANTRTPSGGGA